MECYTNDLIEFTFTIAYLTAGVSIATVSNYVMDRYLKMDKKKIESAGRYIAMYALGWVSAMILYDYIYLKF